MASAKGLGFLFIFLIEVILTGVWIKKFKLYECRKPNTVSFYFYSRWILAIFPLWSAFDNIRLFFGSILSEDVVSSKFSENYFVFVLLLHDVIIFPLLVLQTAIFATRPRIESKSVSDPMDYEVVDIQHRSSKCNKCIWCFALIIILALLVVGVYAFVKALPHNEFTDEWGIYRWGTDSDANEGDILYLIGEQQPVFASVLVLIMNVYIWKRYKYYVPFFITLLSIVGIGALVSSWKAGFFFIGNIFEWTLYFSFYKLDCFMYPPDDEQTDVKQAQDPNNPYYQM